MTKFTRRALIAIVSVTAAVGVFLVGVYFGRTYEKNQFELLKLFAPMQADELLKKGDVDGAIRVLHFAKAFESIRGDQDAELGKAYLVKGNACLAKEFLTSSLAYMEANKLTQLKMYASTKDAFEHASVECAKQEGTRLLSKGG